MSGGPLFPEGAPEAICSAKGCQNPAGWDVQWNNPKIHTPERRKHWLACDDHRESLTGYLSARGLWKETVLFDAAHTPET